MNAITDPIVIGSLLVLTFCFLILVWAVSHKDREVEELREAAVTMGCMGALFSGLLLALAVSGVVQ